MNPRTPGVSIIVPVYNAHTTLAACVDSILGQSFREYEVLLINDGSTDGSAGICDTYSASDSRIKTIHKENGGVSSARNSGLDNAAGEFILFLDADDTLMPEALASLMTAGTDDLVIGGVLHVVSECPDGFLNVPGPRRYDLHEDTGVLDPLLCQVYVTAPWSKRFRRSIIEDSGLRFDTRLFYGEDTDFVLRYINKIAGLRTVDMAITRYNDARQARHTKYSMGAESFVRLAESIGRNIKALREKTGFGFPVLDSFLNGYATDIFFDTLTHKSDYAAFRSEVVEIRKCKELLRPSSRKKKILSLVLLYNITLAYLISRLYNAFNG